MTDDVAPEPQISPAWEAALQRFQRELRTRGFSPHTLRAYGADVAELAEWATRRGLAPGELAYRDLRTYAAALSERGLARSSVARKLAAVRSLHGNLVRAGGAAQNPAELLPSPNVARACPACSGRTRSRRCSIEFPPLGRWRSGTGRCSSSRTPAGCAPTRSSSSTSRPLTSSPRPCA